MARRPSRAAASTKRTADQVGADRHAAWRQVCASSSDSTISPRTPDRHQALPARAIALSVRRRAKRVRAAPARPAGRGTAAAAAASAAAARREGRGRAATHGEHGRARVPRSAGALSARPWRPCESGVR